VAGSVGLAGGREAGRLRVLMVTPVYAPHIGGVERCVQEVSRRLGRRGVDITVLTTDPKREAPPREQADGVTIIRVAAWPRRRDYYFAPDVYRIVSRGDWDLIHVQSYHTFVAPLAMLAAHRRNLPYVVTFHGGGHSGRVRRALRPIQWALLRPLLARAEYLVAIARFEIDVYSKRLRLPRERFRLIPLGTDFGSIASLDDSARSPNPVVASVGRLERYKGHHRLIEALPAILERQPDVSVWIAGVGPYERKLRRLAQSLGVTDHVDIHAVPAADARQMARELSKVALVVLLSEFETQPVAALEAISLGRPVLVFDTPGLSELAERGLAHPISRDSTPDEIAEAVLEQLRDPFVPAAVELPSWDECATGHLDLYLSLPRTAA
jgi:glycosyltransferase involved in cell wall biosynthesis